MSDNYLDEVRCVAFDFCGTLAELTPSSEGILSEWLQGTTAPGADAATLSAVLKRAGEEMPYSSLTVRDEQARRQYFVRFNARVLELLGCDEGNGEDLYAHFLRHKRHWRLRPGAEAMLKELSMRGFKVILASNFDPTLEQLLSRGGTADLFDALFISGALGVEKPDLAFYRHVEDALGLPAQCIAMVGDDLKLDVLPSLAIGMKAIHLRPAADGQAGPRHLPAAGYMEISALDDLLQACSSTPNTGDATQSATVLR
jgi:HAD superfamily hydrolase (TIGR01549 family)